jgi:uncharacterized delta-60 repeat protein
MPSGRPNITPALLALLWFTWVARPAESLLDTTFITGSGADYYVEQVLEQPDGKVLICGLFSYYNGENRPWIARLNSDGTIDRSFNPRPNYWVRHMLVQPDGKIVIGGQFTEVEGFSRNRIARLNEDGSLDLTFDVGTGLETSLATAINGDASPFIIWSELLPDGRILALGNFRTYNGELSSGIARINPDGSRDTTFNTGSGFDIWTRFVHVLPNGDMFIGGWFNSYNGQSFNRLVKLKEDGSADTNFNAYYGDKTAVYSIAMQPGGKLITCGHSLNEQGLFHREIVRLNSDGSVDESWPGRTNEKTESILQQSDGKLIICGYFTFVNDEWHVNLARLNADGTLDPEFRADANFFIWTVAPARDKRILVSGGFTSIDGIPVGMVARLNLPERKALSEPVSPSILSVELIDGKVECRVNSQTGFKYSLQYKIDAESLDWKSLTPVAGTGEIIQLTDDDPRETRFYRVEVR